MNFKETKTEKPKQHKPRSRNQILSLF